MQTTPIADLPYPELTDLPNGPSAFGGLASALDSIVVPRYTNAAARNLAITSPVAGQLSYLTTEGRYERYDGSGWRQMLNAQWGTVTVSFSGVASFTQVVNFPVAFVNAPFVATNIATAPGPSGGWISRGITTSSSSFTLYVAHAAAVTGTWSSVPVQWVAIGV